MYGYIYITTNLINNKKYIGQHKSEVFTEDYKGSGKLLIKAIEKYGIDNFKVELLEECDSLEELNEREKYWKYFDSTNVHIGYNLSKGGFGSSGYKWNDSQKDKLREILRNRAKNIDYSGKNNSFYGKHHSKGKRCLIHELEIRMLLDLKEQKSKELECLIL